MVSVRPLAEVVGFAGLFAAACYSILVLAAALVWKLRREANEVPPLQPVTVLKPLCGAEPGLYRHLRSFCLQNYPLFQIVFGVRDPADPACAVVHRLIEEFPALALELVVNPRLHGGNCKTSNLINMLPHARYDVLVMADSDAAVGPEYLACVTAPLHDRGVGLVTCIYRGRPTASVWSRLGAMYINEWYVPSVLLARLFGHQGYVSGQTICMRRDTLQSIGGLQAIANHLADDYRLGELVREAGLRIVLSSYLIEAEHHEPDFASLARHELRWMRTIRVLRPHSFRGMFLTFSLPLAALGALLASAEPGFAAKVFVGVTVTARLMLRLVHRAPGRAFFTDLWLLPARDCLTCWIWYRSFLTSRVTWRGNEFHVNPDGVMRRLS